MWSRRRPPSAVIVVGGFVAAMLAGAPVFASGDGDPTVASTLCPPGLVLADPSLAPPSLDAPAEPSDSAPFVPLCLPPCEDDGLALESPGSGDPVASTNPTAPATVPGAAETGGSPPAAPLCLPPCDDEESDPADEAVAGEVESGSGDPADAGDPGASATAEPLGMICIPRAEFDAAVAASAEAGVIEAGAIAPPAEPSVPAEPAVPVEPTAAVESIDPIEPIEPELEAPAIPEVPEEGWPIRLIAFPVHGPVRYDDDWGNCRGGSDCPRLHIGNDIIGVRLQPLVAAADGVVTHFVQNHPTAGWGFVITDDEGWDYRYYHVNNDTPGTDDGQDDGTWRFIDGLAVGSEVLAGQVIGFMGDSGNSEHSVPHLHFEIHQPDGVAINPFRSLHLAEWVARCGGASDPYRDVIVPIPFPLAATQPVKIDFGEGEFLVGNDGSWAAIGDARQSGDSRHVDGTPACPPSG